MPETKKYEFNSFFIKRAFPMRQGLSAAGNNKEQEDIVYHYTSPDAFLSIIQHQTIRFTDIRYLNDKTEGIYFVKLLLDFTMKTTVLYPFFAETVNQLLKGNDWARIQNLETTEVLYNEIHRMPYKADRVFVFCACAEPDLLNMWNYYVNNGAYQGYNIGLRVKELLKTFDTPDQSTIDAFQVYYGNVLYDEKRQTSEIRMLAESIERDIEVSSDKEKAIKYAQLNLRSYINTQGAFYKHPKFKAENEFRIIMALSDSRIPRNANDASNFFGKNNRKIVGSFCTKRGLVVPFLTVALPSNAISRVTVAPMVEFDIAKQSIRELFHVYGQEHPPIFKSSVPIRF